MSIFFVSLIILIAFLPLICFGILRFYEYLKFKSTGYYKKNKIKYWEMAKNKGAYGEFLTYCILNKLYPNDEIFLNTYIPINNKTTEADLILVDKTGIYVFESKNYSGWIFGKDTDHKWTVTLQNSKKYYFLNPVKQNEFHIKALKELLNLDDKYFQSIIVFSDRCELKKLTTKTPTMKRSYLKRELPKLIKSKEELLTADEIANINDTLKKYSNVSDEVKEAHIKNLKSN